MKAFIDFILGFFKNFKVVESAEKTTIDKLEVKELPTAPEVVVDLPDTRPNYKFTPGSGYAVAVRDMNIRKGAPSTGVEFMAVSKGTTFNIVGYVTDGEEVGQNSLWYKDIHNNYLWSGNIRLEKDETKRILYSPLEKLTCTQEFGLRPELYKNYGSPGGHNGLDFRTWVDGDPARWEQPVYTVLSGEVTEAIFEAKYNGRYVRIQHYNDHESVYLHLSKILVTAGDTVAAGDQIGISGNSGGASEAPHLHFGYRPVGYDHSNGTMGYIDPTPYFIEDITYV